jgi:hypothetical protein
MEPLRSTTKVMSVRLDLMACLPVSSRPGPGAHSTPLAGTLQTLDRVWLEVIEGMLEPRNVEV